MSEHLLHLLRLLETERQNGLVRGSGDQDATHGTRKRFGGSDPIDQVADEGTVRPDRGEDPDRSLKNLWLNAAGLAAVLFAVLTLLAPSAIVVPDEGLYLAQADALTTGRWSVPRQAVDVDDGGDYSRLLPEATQGDREIPYARHAAYPLVLAPAFWLSDYVGTLVLSLLGLWGAAVSGAFVARRLGRRLAVSTLWLIGIGSPLLFYGYVAMGHAIAAAAAGTAFLGMSRWLDDRAWSGLALGVPALLFTILLRSEGTIYAVAVVATVGLLSLPAGANRRFDRRAFLTAVLLGCAVVATYFLDTRIADAVTGRDGYGINPGAIAMRASADPVSGSWASLFRPFANSWDSGALWVTIAGLMIVAASVLMRRAPQRSRLALVALVTAGVAALAILVDPPWLVTGMLAAFPLLPAGLIWLRRSDLTASGASQVLYRIILVSVIATGGLVATLYANGGAAEWGGRFFQILIPVLAPAAVLGLDRALREFPASGYRIISQRRLAVVCAVLVTAALSVSALRVQAGIRGDAADTVDGTIAYVGREFPGGSTLVVVANRDPSGNSRLFWRTDDSVEVLTTIALEALHPALQRAAEVGRDQLVVVTDATRSEFDDEVSGDLEEIGWTVLDLSSTPLGYSNLFTVGER